MSKPRVLVICTGNSMRSQLAEGVLRAELGDRIEVHSAGTHPSGVHPLTIAALEDVGIDASKHRSKSVNEFRNMAMDLVITVCDSAREACPAFPHAKRIVHRGYPDPIHASPGDNPAQFFSELRELMRRELKDLVVNELNLDAK